MYVCMCSKCLVFEELLQEEIEDETDGEVRVCMNGCVYVYVYVYQM
jgi:hypothetical protein